MRRGYCDDPIQPAIWARELNPSLFRMRLADAFDIHPDPSYDAVGVPRILNQPDEA
jgi:hypothetical protein